MLYSLLEKGSLVMLRCLMPLVVDNDKLPRVGYLTLMDGFTTICFITILIAIPILIIAHRSIVNDDRPQVQRVHNLSRWLGLTAFVRSNLLLLANKRFLQD